MKKIDRLIKALIDRKGQKVTMVVGQKVILSATEGDRAMTTEEILARQIQAMLQEVVPPKLASSVATGKSGQFVYEAPAGVVQISFSSRDGEPCLEITPAAAIGTQAEPAPKPAPAAAAPPRAATPTVPKTRPAHAPAAAGPSAAIDAMFRTMIEAGCSDLHLTSGMSPMVRKDGEMAPLDDSGAIETDRLKEILFEITAQKYRDEFEEKHDTDFSYEIPGVARFRCNLFMDRNGIGGVFRQIPTDIPSAEKLGLSKGMLQLCHLNKGLVVVTGPTGSGKSTTLAAMIDYINNNLSAHIITIEDPIEFVHQNRKCLINQREVGNHTEGFKAALRAALREDPDIVLVGEMRDLETVAIAIETAETGHLVFGTLHTNTAASTVDRMIDQFPADRQEQIRAMLSESLKGVIAQTLCKKKGGGRVAAHEVLIANSAVSNLIREGKTFQIPSIMQVGKGTGMVLLNDALFDLVKNRIVEPADAYAKAISRPEFMALLNRGGFELPAEKGAPAQAEEATATAGTDA